MSPYHERDIFRAGEYHNNHINTLEITIANDILINHLFRPTGKRDGLAFPSIQVIFFLATLTTVDGPSPAETNDNRQCCQQACIYNFRSSAIARTLTFSKISNMS
jgi:hypothetical protein